MSKSKKTPIFKYGIEITKRFTKTMYDHNEICAREMRSNIRHAWSNEVIEFMGNDEWPTEGKIVDIQKSVQAIGYGDGYTIDDVQKDFLHDLEHTSDWQLHENYSYMCQQNMVPRTGFMMLGFNQLFEYDGRFASNSEMNSPVIENTYTMPEPDWTPNC